MHVALAPGERLLPGTREAVARRLEDLRVSAVLVPLRPEGQGALPRAARRYLACWDRRYLHAQNFFAPASRVASREPLPGWRSAEAAPGLRRALLEGRRVEALPAEESAREGWGVATPVARDLGQWIAWAREEGAAWGRLAARDPSFAPFLPVQDRRGWARHNLARVLHRAGEVLEARRRPDPLVVLLHLTREAAWTAASVDARAL